MRSIRTLISDGLSYTIEPKNSSLNNQTTYTFSFDVQSNQTITAKSFNITNSSGGQLLFVSGTGTGIISGVLNTGNNTRLIGRFSISTADESFSVTKVWTVGTEFIGDYSIYRQGLLYMDYEFNDFIRLLMVIGIIFGVVLFMGGIDSLNDGVGKVIVVTTLVWSFSFIGWLDTGIIVNSASATINDYGQYANQFGIAILTTGAGFFFIGRKLFN